MATIVVRTEKPVEGEALATVAAGTPLTEDEAATLYRRALADVTEVAAASGADLLVTHPDAAASVRDVVEPPLENVPSVRFEPQIGSTPGARLGNTVTHLLEEEGASSVGVLDPTAVLVRQSDIDQAAMTLRRHDVVIGPATAGDIHYAGFTDTIDFADVDVPLQVATLADLGAQAGRSVAVIEPSPTLATPAEMRSALPILRARHRAGLAVPERTSEYIQNLGLKTVPAETGRRMEIVRE